MRLYWFAFGFDGATITWLEKNKNNPRDLTNNPQYLHGYVYFTGVVDSEKYEGKIVAYVVAIDELDAFRLADKWVKERTR